MGSIYSKLYSKLPSLPNILTPLSREELEGIKRESRQKRLRYAYEGATNSELAYSDQYTPPGPKVAFYESLLDTVASRRHPEAGRKSLTPAPNATDGHTSNVRPVTRVVEGGEGAIV
jgi:hypothetical protein